MYSRLREAKLIRFIIPALILSGCTTIGNYEAFKDAEPIEIRHEARTYQVRYNYELQWPSVFVTRTVPESFGTAAVRLAARRVEFTSLANEDKSWEKEIAKQVVVLTIKDGCGFAREGDGSTKFFQIGDSNRYRGIIQCQTE